MSFRCSCSRVWHYEIQLALDTLMWSVNFTEITELIKEWFNDYLICLKSSKTGKQIPYPVSSAISATQPVQIRHLICIYCSQGSGIGRYFLVLNDALSSYSCFKPVDGAIAGIARVQFARCYGVLTAPNSWVLDEALQSINDILPAFCKRHLHFTFIYGRLLTWNNVPIQWIMVLYLLPWGKLY